MKRRNLILLLGGASSGAMSVGTGAFSSMEAERSVEVNVEDDEDAYIRYETPSDGKTVEHGEQVTLVRVRNQFGGNQDLALVGVEYEYEDERRENDVLRDITVERYVTPAAPDETLSDEDFTTVNEDHVAIKRGSNGDYPAANEGDAFGPGEWVRIVANTYVPAGENPEIEVTITIQGVEGGVSAQLFGDTRAFTLTGAEDVSVSETPTVDFKGNSGNAKLDGVKSEIRTRVWYRDESEGTLEQIIQNLSNGQIRNELFNGSERSDKRIVAVSLTDLNRTYVREGDNLNPGSSVCYEGVPETEGEFDSGTLSPCD